ncbi:MAG TPA: hypothetical protein VF670_08485 [Duganella sp.]|jgi:hypothetical protein
MVSLKKLRHIAGGLAGSFTHRNNDVSGQWALGLLYLEAPADLRVQLNLLDHTAMPSTRIAEQVARNYGAFLRRAAIKKGVRFEELADAKVDLSFNTAPPLSGIAGIFVGDPFLCKVTLTLYDGRIACAEGVGRCRRHEKGRYLGRVPGGDALLESMWTLPE